MHLSLGFYRLIKLTATFLDAKAATRINAALDATDSVEIDIKMLEPDGDPNMIIISLGLLAIGKNRTRIKSITICPAWDCARAGLLISTICINLFIA